MTKRRTEEEQLAAAEARVAQLKQEADLRASLKADREARGPSATSLNQLGAEWRLVRRTMNVAVAHKMGEVHFGALVELANGIEKKWVAGFEKKRAYVLKHEAGQVELDRVKPLELPEKGASS